MFKTQTIAEAELTHRKGLAARMTYLFFTIAENIQEAEDLAICAYEDEQTRRAMSGEPPLPPLEHFGL